MAWVKRVYRYRLPPCPPYDVEGTESWLGDMAGEGWYLCGNGFFAGFACFVTGEPKQVRYRLEAAPKPASLWDSNNGDPAPEAQALNGEFGWVYVTRRGQFYIYRNDEPGERELNTDPAVQALAVKEVEKRRRFNILYAFYWLFFRPLLRLDGALLLTSIAIGTPLFLLLALLIGWSLVRGVTEVVHLGRLRRKLKQGEPLDHGKDWRSGAGRYYLSRALLAALVIVALWAGLKVWSDDIMDGGKEPIDGYDPPFATVADWFPGAAYSPRSLWENSNYVREWSDWLSPVNIDWAEHADLALPDGAQISGGYYVYYHECANEWIAQRLCEEYIRRDRMKWTVAPENWLEGVAIRLGLKKPPMELYDFTDGWDVDFAAAYPARRGVLWPTVVFRKGNIVVRAYTYSWGEDMTPEMWMTALAESVSHPKE